MSGPPPEEPPTRPFVLHLPDGGVVRGDELPGAPPAYLFLHGLGSVRKSMKSDALLAHARHRGRAFVRIDLRGHGDSSGTIGRVMVSELIADVQRALERVGPCVLVGSSLGGLVATFASVAVPARVLGLCLMAPALGLLANLAGRLDGQGRLQTSNGMLFPVLPHVLDDARRLDEGTLPTRIAVPVLIVHGTDDAVVPCSASERFFAAIPHRRKQLWVVTGGDHRLVDHAPEAYRRLDELLEGPAV